MRLDNLRNVREVFSETARRRETTFVIGTIHSVDAAGAKFTVPEWDAGKHVFGPAPWSMSRTEPAGSHGGHPGSVPDHDHLETLPPVGADCLVAFIPSAGDPDQARIWVVGWWHAT